MRQYHHAAAGVAAAFAFAAAIMLGGCTEPSFKVKGTVEGAEGSTLVLERPDHAGIWVGIDSVELKDNGKFSFSQMAPADPEIYRLRLKGDYIYFPVDSVETITIDARAPRFATDFSIAGYDQAVALGKFEKELIAKAAVLDNPDSARNFKRHVYTAYLQDARGSVVSYYILTKTINGQPLFRLPDDSRYFAAVATAFREYRPSDPRLQLLTETATASRRQTQRELPDSVRRILQANAAGYIDIALPDVDGKDVKLSDKAGKGSATLLVFSNLSDPATPALNAELRKLQGVQIYNVGLDDDQLAWRNAAANLPWTCVYATDTDAATLVRDYQVAALPTIFVIDAAGNLTARCTSMADVRAHLR